MTDQRRTPAGLRDAGNAVVIGSGMGGLVAAQLLTEHFDQVVVLERDNLSGSTEDAGFRSGVPQGRHPHLLLAGGQQLLEDIFPGLSDDLSRAGAEWVDWVADCVYVMPSGLLPRFDSKVRSQVCSRGLLEAIVRRRVSGNPRVKLSSPREVVGLELDAVSERIVGVKVRHRASEGSQAGGGETIAASLVVDASGRASRAQEWLRELGCPPPEETTITSFLGYASRWYERPADFRTDWKAFQVVSTPPSHSRGAAIWGAEGGRWQVTLGGVCGDYPPTDEAGFLEFARSLPTPAVLDVIEHSRPVSPIYGSRDTANRWRRYDRLGSLPAGFVVLGDAACAVNPVFAQGMTLAAKQAMCLSDALRATAARRGTVDVHAAARAYHAGVRPLLEAAWGLVTSEDLRWAAAQGRDKTPWVDRLYNGYIDELLALTDEQSVVEAFLGVMHMVRSPWALLDPKIAGRVLLRSLQRRAAGLLAKTAPAAVGAAPLPNPAKPLDRTRRPGGTSIDPTLPR
jgi:2-polyprenyl-6-methoxyphenol hydroxylase-like FAD-dependent oxidoreductase